MSNHKFKINMPERVQGVYVKSFVLPITNAYNPVKYINNGTEFLVDDNQYIYLMNLMKTGVLENSISYVGNINIVDIPEPDYIGGSPLVFLSGESLLGMNYIQNSDVSSILSGSVLISSNFRENPEGYGFSLTGESLNSIIVTDYTSNGLVLGGDPNYGLNFSESIDSYGTSISGESLEEHIPFVE